MTVYKPKNSRHYHFDFQFKGVRYHGSTGCQSKRDAERYERDQRTEVALGTKVKPSLTIDQALGTFYAQKGRHEKDTSVPGQLKRLTQMLGANKVIGDLTQLDMTVYVATRRGMKARGKETLISAATVNRELELLRRIIAHFEDSYSMPEIAWGKLMLKEPQERVRELSQAEEQRLFEQLPEDLAKVVDFAILSGQRRTAIITLLWSKVDFDKQEASVFTKGGKWHTFPLTPRMMAIIANRPKVAPQVFTYECERSAPAKQGNPPRVKGERYPFSKQGWTRKWRAALARAGVEDFRFHDLRHTAGSRVTRNSNLKVTQKLLGHTKIETTARYAHVSDTDMRKAMAASESRIIPEHDTVVALKPAEKLGK